MKSKSHKNAWILITIITQISIIIMAIAKQTVWIGITYALQIQEKKIAVLKQQKKELLHALYEVKNPHTIKMYAQNTLNLHPVPLQKIQRLHIHE